MITRPEIMEGIRRHIQPIGGQENLNILEVEPGHVRLSIELTEACPHLIRKGRHTSADKVAVQYFTEAANPDNYIYQ